MIKRHRFFKSNELTLINNMGHRSIYIMLLSLIGFNALSQEFDEKNFTLYTTKDGLSHNYVNAITQDSYGYVWIATYKGLNRFDGSTFQQFYSDSGRNDLPQNLILKLKWLDKKELAIPTFFGLHIIDTKNLSGQNLFVPPDPAHPGYFVNRVFDVSSNKKADIFILTSTGFYHFRVRKNWSSVRLFFKVHSTGISSFDGI